MAQPQDAEKELEYLLPEPRKEVERLTAQDSVLTYSMDNKRILVPLDVTQPGLKILDSGTADGLFLRAIPPLLTPPFTLEGYDVMPIFFPPSTPPHTTLAIHNLAEEWPARMHGQYDFVHQRLSLLGAAQQAPLNKAVGYLGALVKPGGWIQLGELDVRELASGGKAMEDAWTVVRAVFRAFCGDDDFVHKMADWLRAEGFEDVCEKSYEIGVGPRCKDPEMGKKSMDVTLGTWTALLGAAQNTNASLDESVTDRLIERLEEELTAHGASYKMHYAIGRKPQ